MTSDVGQWSHGSPAGPATSETIAGLRWRRPRRAAELAQEALHEAAGRADRSAWLRAAGWLLHCRSATGDARETALDLLDHLTVSAGQDALRRPESARLRVELAALAQANGDPETARDLLRGWTPDRSETRTDRDELELDRLAVLVRCALVDGAGRLAELRAEVEALSHRLDGEPVALAELLLGSVHRDDGEPAAAAERALRGLARLGWTPADPASPPSSPHLGYALLSQWATSLLEDGSAAGIPDGVKQLEVVDGGRHGVLWRLAVARAFAGRARPTADVLEDAAAAAAAVDAPSLEAACRSAQAELFEGAGRYQDALVAVRAAMDAERTDRERAERLREALAGPAASLHGRDGVELSGGGLTEDERIGRDRSPAAVWPALRRSEAAPPVSSPDVTWQSGAGPSDPAPGVPDGDRPDSAGSALASLDVSLDVFEDASPAADAASRPGADDPAAAAPAASGAGGTADSGVDVTAADEDGTGLGATGDVVGTSPAAPAWQLPGSRGADTAAGGEGSPLGDALLAELRDAARSSPAPESPSPSPSSNGRRRAVPDPERTVSPEHTAHARMAPPEDARAPGRQASGLAIVLDLVGSGGGAVPHPDLAAVGADLAARAQRLVPAGTHVIGPDGVGERTAPGSLVEVWVPGVEGVAAQLWARSLVGHLAGRVDRRRLPDTTLLRARLVGADGPVGDTEQRVLDGPADVTPAALQRHGSDPDAGAAGPRRGGSPAPQVRPGSGGRRRRPVVDDGPSPEMPGADAAGEAAAAAETGPGDRRNGAVHTGGPGRHGADTAREEPTAAARRSRRHRAPGEAWSLPGGGDTGLSGPGGAVTPRRPRAAVAPGDGHAAAHGIPSAGAPTHRAVPAAGAGHRAAAPDTGVPVGDVVPDGATFERGAWTVADPVGWATNGTDPPGSRAGRDRPGVDSGSTVDGRSAGEVTPHHGDHAEHRAPTGPAGVDDVDPHRPEDAGPGTGDGSRSGASGAESTPSRRDRRPRSDRRSARGGRGRDGPATGADPTAIPDDLGLGDLLAGALAAYRDI